MWRAQHRVGLVLALWLLVVLVWWGWRADAPRVRQGDGDHQLWHLRRDRITVVERLNEPTWRLERDEVGWWVRTSGWRWPANPRLVSRLTDALDEAGRGVLLDEVDAAELGLDLPVVLRIEEGGEVYRLEVGRTAPVGGRTYVRSERGEALAVYGGIGEVGRALALELVDDAVLRDEALDRVVLLDPAGAAYAASFDGAVWVGSAAGAPDRVSDWAHSWRDLRVQRWSERAPEGARWRLSSTGASGLVERELWVGEGAWVVFGDGRVGELDLGEVAPLLDPVAAWGVIPP